MQSFLYLAVTRHTPEGFESRCSYVLVCCSLGTSQEGWPCSEWSSCISDCLQSHQNLFNTLSIVLTITVVAKFIFEKELGVRDWVRFAVGALFRAGTAISVHEDTKSQECLSRRLLCGDFLYVSDHSFGWLSNKGDSLKEHVHAFTADSTLDDDVMDSRDTSWCCAVCQSIKEVLPAK